MKITDADKINEVLDRAYESGATAESVIDYVEDALSTLTIEIKLPVVCECGHVKFHHEAEGGRCWVCDDRCGYRPVLHVVGELPQCETCKGTGKSQACPYCEGPEADYHTMCIESDEPCGWCKGTGVRL